MTTTARMAWTALLVAAVGPVLGGLWGFSVDDAWIVSRVAENGLDVGSFAYNRLGPRTDAVTPLGFAEILAAGCRLTGTTDAFSLARFLGAGLYLLTMAVAAWIALGREQPTAAHPLRTAVAWAATAGLSPSLAAWAGAGLETPVVGALTTVGCALGDRAAFAGDASRRLPDSCSAGALLGVAVAWRPELAGFAVAAAIQLYRMGTWRSPTSSPRSVSGAVWAWLPCALFLLPGCAVASARSLWFGGPLPLSLLAKQPDLASGLRYTLGSLLFCGPLLLVWPLLVTPERRARAWRLPFLAHAVCVLLAGGDWMPFYRLWVPVLPWLIAVGLRDLPGTRRALGVAILAALPSAALLGAHGASARAVVARREWMVEELRPWLAGARAIAAVDVGWVGRATSAAVVDLGGVTDPRVAALPGGHTSRRIEPGFFAARSVDAWLVRASSRDYVPGAPVESIQAAYAVDARLVRRAADLNFRGVATIPLPGTAEQYVVLRHAAAEVLPIE